MVHGAKLFWTPSRTLLKLPGKFVDGGRISLDAAMDFCDRNGVELVLRGATEKDAVTPCNVVRSCGVAVLGEVPPRSNAEANLEGWRPQGRHPFT